MTAREIQHVAVRAEIQGLVAFRDPPDSQESMA